MTGTKLYDMNKIRNDSAVFSTTHFTNLLKRDDYSFLDLRIKKSQKKPSTYLEHIKNIYKNLQENYRNEYIYKNTLINKLLIRKYYSKNTIVINEFRVGRSIADIVLFNGTSKAFEIKTELDTDKRLNSQLKDYVKIFKECYIVTSENLIDRYSKIDENIGLIALYSATCRNALKIEEIRKPTPNENIDAETLMDSIRTYEYKSIVKKYYGNESPEMNDFNMFRICLGLMKNIPDEKLNSLFIKTIKKRKNNTKDLKNYQEKELSQLALAMHLNTKKYNQLIEKLNKPIQD